MSDLVTGKPLITAQPAGASYPAQRQVSVRNIESFVPDTVGYGWNFDAAGLVFIILIPVIVWLILFATRCSLGTAVDSNGHTEINTTKLGFWTAVITIIIYILLWVFVTLIPRGMARVEARFRR